LAKQTTFSFSISKFVENFFYLNGKPYSLDDYPHMRIIYDIDPQYLVLNTSRQVSKCGRNSSIWALSDGTKKLVKDLIPGDELLSFDIETQKIITNKIKYVEDNGLQSIYKIKTRTGKIAEVTGEHPFWTLFPQWTEAKDLKVGDLIGISKNNEVARPTEKTVPDYEYIILSHLLMEGGLSTETICYTNSEKENSDELNKAIQLFDENIELVNTSGDGVQYRVRIKKDQKPAKNTLKRWLETLHLMGKKSDTKFLPSLFYKLTKKQICDALRIIWNTDGYISTASDKYLPEIGIGLISKELIDGISDLLLRIGIHNSKSVQHPEIYKNTNKSVYKLRIEGADAVERFYQLVPTRKLKAYKKVEQNNNRLVVPKKALQPHFNKLKKEHSHNYCNQNNTRHKQGFVQWSLPYDITYSKLKNFNELFHDEYLQTILDADIIYDRITEIEILPPEPTTSIQMEDPHNTFLIDNIVTHNSTFLSIRSLANSLIMPQAYPKFSGGFKTLYVAPTVEQVRLFSHERVSPVIEQTPLIKQHYVRSSLVQNVFQRRFINGSTMFFRYGGTTADRIRGISSDMCNMDEVQDLPNDNMEVAELTMARSMYKHVIYAGTPKRSIGSLASRWKKSTQNEWMPKCAHSMPEHSTVYVRENNIIKNVSFKDLYDQLDLPEEQQEDTYIKYPESLFIWNGKKWDKALRVLKSIRVENIHITRDKGRAVLTSGDHEIKLNSGKFLKAQEIKGESLSLGDCPEREINITSLKFKTNRDTLKICDHCGGKIRTGRHSGNKTVYFKNGTSCKYYRCYSCTKYTRRTIKDHKFIEIDPWLIGMWITDGFITNGGIGWCQKRKDVKNKLIEILKTVDLPINITANKENPGMFSFRLCDIELKKYFKDNYGTNCFNKHIDPKLIFHATDEILYKILAGALDGDGTISHGFGLIRMSSQYAIEQLTTICRILKLKCHRTFSKAGLHGMYFEINKDLILQSAKATKEKFFKNSSKIYPVMVFCEEVGEVYDITTESSEFESGGIVVHNCNKYNFLDEQNIQEWGLACRYCKLALSPKNGVWVRTNDASVKNKNTGAYLWEGFRISVLQFSNAEWVDWQRDVYLPFITKPKAIFFNEFLGLAHDAGVAPITEDEIRACCTGGPMLSEPDPMIKSYPTNIGIDWGPVNSSNSHTVLSVMQRRLGLTYVVYMKRFEGHEADFAFLHDNIPTIFRKWNSQLIGADYGFGEAANSEIRRRLADARRVIAVQHVPNQKQPMHWNQQMQAYTLGRNKMMTELFQKIKKRQIVFPQWSDFQPFAKDILAIAIDYNEELGRYKYVNSEPDDSFHSILYGDIACFLYEKATGSKETYP
jgi:intein/homing endonuclease